MSTFLYCNSLLRITPQCAAFLLKSALKEMRIFREGGRDEESKDGSMSTRYLGQRVAE